MPACVPGAVGAGVPLRTSSVVERVHGVRWRMLVIMPCAQHRAREPFRPGARHPKKEVSVRPTPRSSAKALALVLAHYAFAAAALVVILLLDVEVSTSHRSGTEIFEIYVVSVLLACPLAAALLVGRGVGAVLPPGVEPTPQEQPALFERIGRIAAEAGAPVPDAVRLTAEPLLDVSERVRLLGLVPGRRTLLLGLPLLAGLTPAELDAALAHELAHAAPDGAPLSGFTVRNRAALRHVHDRYGARRGGVASFFDKLTVREDGRSHWLAGIGGRRGGEGEGERGQWLGELFRSYARRGLAATAERAARREAAADATAARIAGPAAAVAVLTAVPALTEAYRRYLADFAALGAPLGLRPADEEFLPGFTAFVAGAAWQREDARLRTEPPRRRAGEFDAHPPLAERLAALWALSAGTAEGAAQAEAEAEAGRRAWELLERAEAVGAQVAAVRPEAAGLRPVDWSELAAACGTAELEREGAPLRAAAAAVLRGGVDLPALLDAVDTGRWPSVVDWMPREPGARTDGAQAASDCLYSLALAELVAQGRGRWTLDWESGPRLTLDDGLDPALGPALDAAVATTPPDTAELRALLTLSAAPGARGTARPAHS